MNGDPRTRLYGCEALLRTGRAPKRVNERVCERGFGECECVREAGGAGGAGGTYRLRLRRALEKLRGGGVNGATDGCTDSCWRRRVVVTRCSASPIVAYCRVK